MHIMLPAVKTNADIKGINYALRAQGVLGGTGTCMCPGPPQLLVPDGRSRGSLLAARRLPGYRASPPRSPALRGSRTAAVAGARGLRGSGPRPEPPGLRCALANVWFPLIFPLALQLCQPVPGTFIEAESMFSPPPCKSGIFIFRVLS